MAAGDIVSVSGAQFEEALAPGRARGLRGVRSRPDEQVLVLDLLGHRGLIRDPLDQLGLEQLVFAPVMDGQRRDAEIDVIGQEDRLVARTSTSSALYHVDRQCLIH